MQVGERVAGGDGLGWDRGREEGRKGAKHVAKPAGRCRAMTPHSVYGSDVDQLYATYANAVCVITQCENLP